MQELRLGRDRHLGDLVQQNRPLVTHFKLALLALVSPCECSGLIAEEFAYQQFNGKGGAVHLHESSMGSCREFVNQPGDYFLACPTLSKQ